MGASLAIFIKTIYQKIKQRKKGSMVDVESLPREQEKSSISNINKNNDESSHDEIFQMIPKEEGYLKKKMCEGSTVLSPRIKY